MWAEEQRRIYRREGGEYPSDLKDAERARLEPMIPPGVPVGFVVLPRRWVVERAFS